MAPAATSEGALTDILATPSDGGVGVGVGVGVAVGDGVGTGVEVGAGAGAAVAVGTGVGEGVGVQVGGRVGIGKSCERRLLFSLLSSTWSVESTKAVLSPGQLPPENQRETDSPGASPETACCAPFTSTTNGPAFPVSVFVIPTLTPRMVEE